jgi:hypothetical protein
MITLLTGIATTTVLGAFSEGLITSLVAYPIVKSGGKANISIKK